MIIPYKEGTIYLLAVNNNMDEKIRYRDNGKFYIEKDDEPEYVLDPFSGSGTVAVSAKKHGCDYIGFDFVQEYVDKANERIEKS